MNRTHVHYEFPNGVSQKQNETNEYHDRLTTELISNGSNPNTGELRRSERVVKRPVRLDL